MNASTTSSDLDRIAGETGFGRDAVQTMDDAIRAGWGRMAQFRHREFGGSGQWMHGGLLMTADPADRALAARIGDLCSRLAGLHADDDDTLTGNLFDEPTSTVGDASRWWPPSLGLPASSGAQDGLRYAYFPDRRRLAVEHDGVVTTYDTGDHRIGGFAQRQGGSRSLSFASQHGPLSLDGLRRADDATAVDADATSSRGEAEPAPAVGAAALDPFVALERLADLHARGIVDAAEFAAKKAELLRRI